MSNVLCSAESSEKMMDLVSDGDCGFAIFDSSSRLVSFSQAFFELYTRSNLLSGRSKDSSSHQDTLMPCWDKPLQEGMCWREILTRAGCRVPITLAPVNAKVDSPQEVLLGRKNWIKVYSWRTEEGKIVSVHSDISEIKLRIKERRLRFQMSRGILGGSFPTINVRHHESCKRRASTGACCQTIKELPDSGTEEEGVNASCSGKLSKSLPTELKSRDESLATTPIMAR